MMLRTFVVPAAVAAAFITTAASAGSVSIGAAKDNTLYEAQFFDLSSGDCEWMFSGRTFQGDNDRRRGLMAFDVAGNVPAGATITSATLTLTVIFTNNFGPHDMTIHRVLQDWGEAASICGVSGGGGGGEPLTGDATWQHTFYVDQFWNSNGGDFVPTASGTEAVGGNGDYTWGSTSQMVADVQGWLDNPAGNYGWILVGDEETGATAKKLSSREGGNPPSLVIQYDEPAPCDGDTNGDGSVDVNDLNNVILDWGTDGSGNGGDITGPVPGSPPDGIVDVNDLNAVIVNWGDCP